MNKNKKGYLINISLLLCLFSSSWLYSQDTSYTNKFLGSWVAYSGYAQDTLVYVPFNSPLSEELSMELRFGGISFGKEHLYLQHRWKMCGNDTGPDFYKGKWDVLRSNHGYLLSVTDFDKITVTDTGTVIDKITKSYFVLEIASDRMLLVPVQ